MIARLALLSSIKHWKRSLVTLGAVAAATATMIAIGGLLNGITGGFYDSVIPNSGHVRIDDARAATALNPFDPALLLPEAGAAIARIKALRDRRIVDVEPLLSFGALLVEDRDDIDPRNLAMRAMGVVPETRFADNARYTIKEGAFLPGGQGIAISRRAAALLGARLGSGLLVSLQDRNGQPWYERLLVTGLFESESATFDETTFFIALDRAAPMLDAEGMAKEIRLLLADRDQAETVAKEVAAALDTSRGADGSALRVESWQTINVSISSILLFIKILLGIIMGLFAIVAGTIIANTSLMSVMERIREYGTMRAIGLRAAALEGLIRTEGLILGAAGALVGLGLGALLLWLLMRDGIDLGGVMENLGLSRRNRPRPDLLWFLFCAAAGLLVSALATARAARTVASMGVAEGLATAS